MNPRNVIVTDIDHTIADFPFWGLFGARPNHCVRNYLLDRHAAGDEIHYITARPTWTHDLTLQWLKKHRFPVPDHLTVNVLPNVPRAMKIHSLCHNSHTCTFIDDRNDSRETASTLLTDLPMFIADPRHCHRSHFQKKP